MSRVVIMAICGLALLAGGWRGAFDDSYFAQVEKGDVDYLAYKLRVETAGGAIYNTALTESALLYAKENDIWSNTKAWYSAWHGIKTNSGGSLTNIYDFTTNNFDGVQATVAAQPTFLSGVLNFDGGDWYEVNTNVGNFGLSDFSISVWVKAHAIKTYDTFIGNGLYAAGWDSFLLCFNSDSKFSFSKKDTEVYSYTAAATGVWYHVVGVYETNSGIVYMNGNAGTRVALEADYDITRNRTTYIGRNRDATYPRYFRGKLDDVRFFNRALTLSEVTNLYDATKGYDRP